MLEILAAQQRGVDQIGDGRIFQIDDSLAHQIGEVENSAVGGQVATQGGLKQGPAKPQTAGTGECEKISVRPVPGKLPPRNARSSSGREKFCQLHRASYSQRSTAPQRQAVNYQGVALEASSPLQAIIPDAQPWKRHGPVPDLESAGKFGFLPGSPDIHIYRQQAPHSIHRWRQRLEDARGPRCRRERGR